MVENAVQFKDSLFLLTEKTLPSSSWKLSIRPYLLFLFLLAGPPDYESLLFYQRECSTSSLLSPIKDEWVSSALLDFSSLEDIGFWPVLFGALDAVARAGSKTFSISEKKFSSNLYWLQEVS